MRAFGDDRVKRGLPTAGVIGNGGRFLIGDGDEDKCARRFVTPDGEGLVRLKDHAVAEWGTEVRVGFSKRARCKGDDNREDYMWSKHRKLRWVLQHTLRHATWHGTKYHETA